MKTLINNTTGEILQYFKVLRSEQKVVYKIYSNGLLYNQQTVKEDGLMPINFGIQFDTPISFNPGVTSEAIYNNTMEFLGLATLKQASPGFVESENNWIFETGSTGNSTTVRVFIPSDLFAKVMYTGEPLDLLIQAMSPLKDWTTRNDSGIVQYLEELLPEHKAIIEMYAEYDVLIEYKN